MKAIGALVLLLVLSIAGCSSLDNEAATDSAKPGTVPGEVNPDAPDASQGARTSPGWNF